jgi:hypothetical protein
MHASPHPSNNLGKGFMPCAIGENNPVTVLLPDPDWVPARPLIGRVDLVRQCAAAWATLDGEGPLHFRLVGPPGVGKNELIYHLAREVERKPLWIMQGHEELQPEDVACTARITSENRIEYVGSGLLAAMVRGGICFFDEIGKVPSRSLSLLASVLDGRRAVTSVLAGFTARAHPDFRFCAALNDADAAIGGLPAYIDERIRPAFRMGYPPIDELMGILESRGRGTEVLLERFRLWACGRELSPRGALHILGYAHRLLGSRATKQVTIREADNLIRSAASVTTTGGSAI